MRRFAYELNCADRAQNLDSVRILLCVLCGYFIQIPADCLVAAAEDLAYFVSVKYACAKGFADKLLPSGFGQFGQFGQFRFCRRVVFHFQVLAFGLLLSVRHVASV